MSVEAKDLHELQRWPGPQQEPGNFPDWKISGWEKLGEALGAEQWCLQLSLTTLLGMEREGTPCLWLLVPSERASVFQSKIGIRPCLVLTEKTWRDVLFQSLMVLQVLLIWFISTELKSLIPCKMVEFFSMYGPVQWPLLYVLVKQLLTSLEETLLLTYRN